MSQRRKRRTLYIVVRVTPRERQQFEAQVRPDETLSDAARRLLLRAPTENPQP